MATIPFVSRRTNLMVIDQLCSCGGKWSEHASDLDTLEAYGGVCEKTSCKRFRFASYIYEESREDDQVPQESSSGRFVQA